MTYPNHQPCRHCFKGADCFRQTDALMKMLAADDVIKAPIDRVRQYEQEDGTGHELHDAHVARVARVALT